MDELDGDGGLKDANGKKAKRDIVQFVPFNDCKNVYELSEKVLFELPGQYL